jgi:hypothetical protein
MENGGRQVRVGIKFHEFMEKIQLQRIVEGTSKDKVSMEKITNMIIKHNFWKAIYQDIVHAKEEEINNYGK